MFQEEKLGERSVVSEQARAGTWLTMVVGERTQAVVVESLQRVPPGTLSVHPASGGHRIWAGGSHCAQPGSQ